MNVINRIIVFFIKKRRKRLLKKNLEVLKAKLEVKKILSCELMGNCTDTLCPFFSLIENYDKKNK